MKKIFLLLGFNLAFMLAFSQQNPCPNIISHGFTTVTNDGMGNCTTKVYVNASGDVGAQKGLRIQVYEGLVSGGILLADECFIVPRRSPANYYETPSFTVPCNATITYVITRYTASNGTCSGGTCGLTITVEGGPLPVKLESFNAKRNNNSVVLNWKTSFEQNVKEFVIQKAQGNSFIDVAIVPASNNPGGHAYSFSEINTSKSVSQYRIKTIDIDGKHGTSEIKAVKGTDAATEFTIFPNPTRNSAKITISDASESTEIQVMDNAGRLVKTINLVNTNSTELHNLQKGIYMIRILNKTSGEATVKKLTVIN